MSFIYSQALVEASSQANYSDTDASQPLSGSLTPKPCLWHDKTTEPFRLSRFGMTCEPLTEHRGEELLTWWLAGFPAKTSALQEKAQASQASEAGCGVTWRGSLARFDPVMSLWKTAQHSLLEDSEPCSMTWPRSGMTADGQCWELPMLGRRTSAIDSGFWVPTPCAMDAGSGRMNTLVGSLKQRPMLALMARKNLWPTPVKSDSSPRRPSANWNGTDLPSAVWRQNGGKTNPQKPPVKLNAYWVEWLMGWPIGHTDLKQLATDKYRFAPQQHSECSQVNLSEVA